MALDFPAELLARWTSIIGQRLWGGMDATVKGAAGFHSAPAMPASGGGRVKCRWGGRNTPAKQAPWRGGEVRPEVSAFGVPEETSGEFTQLHFGGLGGRSAAA
eukprot:GGOE01024553.1.p3 GENE.GGOE01024553.1~~GGOE01024553.1.p3  ORF type:complete len:103 (+),score=7.87 GGOE01024553.1:590-898(+)